MVFDKILQSLKKVSDVCQTASREKSFLVTIGNSFKSAICLKMETFQQDNVMVPTARALLDMLQWTFPWCLKKVHLLLILCTPQISYQ